MLLKIYLLFGSKKELLLIKIRNIKNSQNNADRKNTEVIIISRFSSNINSVSAHNKLNDELISNELANDELITILRNLRLRLILR